MKTKELIRRLQECDPSGEFEVAIGNRPIYTVDVLPAYYDGNLQMLIQDHSVETYNIIGYKVTGEGFKVSLGEMSLGQVLSEDIDTPVDLSELAGHAKKVWEEIVAKERQQTADVNKEVDEWMADRKK